MSKNLVENSNSTFTLHVYSIGLFQAHQVHNFVQFFHSRLPENMKLFPNLQILESDTCFSVFYEEKIISRGYLLILATIILTRLDSRIRTKNNFFYTFKF